MLKLGLCVSEMFVCLCAVARTVPAQAACIFEGCSFSKHALEATRLGVTEEGSRA